MRSLAYFVIPSRKLVGSPSGTTYIVPKLVDGQKFTQALRFLDVIDGQYVEVTPGVRSVSAYIGSIDERPSSGTLKIQIGPGPSTSDNTTALIDRNENAASLQTKFNAVVAKPGPITVALVPGGWLIRRNDGGALQLSIVENTLWPVAFGDLRSWQESGKWLYELRLRVAPFSFTDHAERVDPPAPSIIRLQSGFTADGGTSYTNEVQKLIVPRDFRAAYFIKDPRTQVRTSILTLGDNDEDIQTALNAILQTGESVTVTDVTTTGPLEARIEFGGELAGTPVDLFEVVVAPDAPPGDVMFTLPLDRPEFFAALRDQQELKDVPFEITLDLVPSPADEANLAIPAARVKSAGFFVTLGRSPSFDSLAVAAGTDWLRPPKSTGYVPYHPSQVGVGQQYYPELIGDGAKTHWVIDHNLGAPALTGFQLVNQTTGELIRTGWTAHIASANSLVIDFDVAPASNSVLVMLAAPQSLSVFLAGLMVQIAQVVGLQDVLDQLSQRLAAVEAVLPATGPGTSAAAGQASLWQIEDSFYIYPKGMDPKVAALLSDLKISSAEEGEAIKLPEIDVTALPSPGMLLPAVHDATVNLGIDGNAPLPDPATQVNQVGAVTAGTLTLPRVGNQTRGSAVSVGGVVASDGRAWYAVRGQTGTRSYHSVGFELQLFSLDINESMLRIGATFNLEFNIALQLLKANCHARYLLTIETGKYMAETGGAPPFGFNLSAVNWGGGTIALSQQLDFSSVLASHRFGLRIKRNVDGIVADTLTYGTWTGNAPAPDSANFAVRALLSRFDTENVSAPRGFIYAITHGVKATIGS